MEPLLLNCECKVTTFFHTHQIFLHIFSPKTIKHLIIKKKNFHINSKITLYNTFFTQNNPTKPSKKQQLSTQIFPISQIFNAKTRNHALYFLKFSACSNISLNTSSFVTGGNHAQQVPKSYIDIQNVLQKSLCFIKKMSLNKKIVYAYL